jgi:hypothetical protein
MALNIQELLDEVVTVSEQVTASQGASDGTRTLGKALERSGNLVSDNATTLADSSGRSEEEIFALADLLSSLAEVTLPKTAGITWKSPELQGKIDKLEAALTLEMLSDAQVTLFDSAKAILKTGGGSRGPRGEATTIEGKATRVLILSDGDKLADLGGNTAQSPGNLANRLGKLCNVTDTSSDEYKALKVYAHKACSGEIVEIPGTSLTLMPFEPED